MSKYLLHKNGYTWIIDNSNSGVHYGKYYTEKEYKIWVGQYVNISKEGLLKIFKHDGISIDMFKGRGKKKNISLDELFTRKKKR